MFTMVQTNAFKSSIWKVFEIFVDEPLKIHYVKEIARKINLAPTSIKKHLENLEKEEIIIRKMGERFNGYISNRDYEKFLFYKQIFNKIKIKESGLIDYLINLIHPKTIVLYGSYDKGEDVEESDIDLIIISNVKKNLKLEKYEKILKRKIHLILENNINKLNKNLKLEIINGNVLQGYLKNE